MTLCSSCKSVLASKVQKQVYDKHDAELLERCKQPTSLGHCHYPKFSEVYAHKDSCWLCVRMWAWLRILADPQNRLSTDDEVLASDCWGMRDPNEFETNWAREINCGSDSEGPYHNRLHVRIPKHVTDSGPGPVFRILDPIEGKSILQTAQHKYRLTKQHFKSEMRLKPWPKSRTMCTTIPSERGQVTSWKSSDVDIAKIKRIRCWLDRCKKNQSCMAASQADVSLPARLIYVGDTNEEVRLIATSALKDSERPRYATLSHCWGQNSFHKLTVANEEQFHRRIPMEELEATFRDAIRLCQELEIKYIWIDCLCIVQDSAESADWIAESPKMHMVYGNSYLNIAAAASIDSGKGLFRSLNPLLFEDLSIILPDGRVLHESAWSGRQELLTRLWKASPLHVRGWVVQELYLSPRNLHFTDAQMYWQCECERTAEMIEENAGEEEGLGPLSSSFGPSVSDDNLWYSLRSKVAHGSWPSSTPSQLDRLWCQVISHYSDTKLTFERDKLIALSGLAANFHRRYADAGVTTKYLAGCWEHSLAFWLSHQTVHVRKPVNRQPNLPTWSWLSVGRQVQMEDCWQAMGDNNQDASAVKLTLLDDSNRDYFKINYSLDNVDVAYGAIHSAQIHCRSTFFKLVMMEGCCTNNWSSAGLVDRNSEEIWIYGQYGDPKGIRVYLDDDITQEDMKKGDDGEFAHRQSTVPVVYIARTTNRKDGTTTHFGLILRENPDKVDGKPTYQRRGMVRLTVLQSDLEADLMEIDQQEPGKQDEGQEAKQQQQQQQQKDNEDNTTQIEAEAETKKGMDEIRKYKRGWEIFTGVDGEKVEFVLV